MTGDRLAEHDLLIVGDAEGAVILGETFVEPHGSVFESVFDEQVSVLVEEDVKRILLAADFRRECDVVDVRTGLKIAGAVCSRFERSV